MDLNYNNQTRGQDFFFINATAFTPNINVELKKKKWFLNMLLFRQIKK